MQGGGGQGCIAEQLIPPDIKKVWTACGVDMMNTKGLFAKALLSLLINSVQFVLGNETTGAFVMKVLQTELYIHR